MNELDPGLMTLLASVVGAILFFCAGVFWNRRPEAAVDEPRARPVQAPASKVASQGAAFGGVSGGFGKPIPARSRITPPLVPALQKGSELSAPASLRSYLETLTQTLDASSVMLLDEQGLLFTEGRDVHGVGARLCALLASQAELPQDSERFAQARAFQMGSLHLSRLGADAQEGPDVWLASVGATRFASKAELATAGRALRSELGI